MRCRVSRSRNSPIISLSGDFRIFRMFRGEKLLIVFKEYWRLFSNFNNSVTDQDQVWRLETLRTRAGPDWKCAEFHSGLPLYQEPRPALCSPGTVSNRLQNSPRTISFEQE